MDAQHSLDRIAGLTSLVRGLARHAVEAPDPVEGPEDLLIALLEAYVDDSADP